MHRRAERDATGRFLVEGANVVREALSAGARIETLFAVPHARTDGVVELARERGVPVVEVSDNVMAALAATASPQGVAAVAARAAASWSDLDAEADLIVVLAEVRDPGNAGTIVRSALGAGASAVVFSQSSVDPWGAKTVRASAGALFRIPVVQAEVEQAARALRDRRFTLVGADARAELRCDEFDWTGRVALVVGNEAWGFPPGVSGLVDTRVAIPMPGPLESLNAGIAASVLMYEAVRQRAAAGRS